VTIAEKSTTDTVLELRSVSNTFVPPNKRNMGMVFQSYALWPHMTVYENVAHPLKLRGQPKSEIRERVLSILDTVGMRGLESRPIPKLSGGQQQRVALARAIIYEPKMLLLDEPFSNLDAQLRTQMRIELRTIQRRLGMTTLFVTHDQVEALSIADRIAVIDDGRLIQIGTPQEVYRQPATKVVRDFLGRVIIFSGRVTTIGENEAAVEFDGIDGDALLVRTTAAGTPQQCAEHLVKFAPLGVEEITIRATSRDQFGQLDMIINEVLPLVKELQAAKTGER